jgi:dihydropyrimidinase
MHIDFALPTNHDLAQGFLDFERKAAKSVMDYGFHMAVTSWNEKVARDMGDLVKKGGFHLLT